MQYYNTVNKITYFLTGERGNQCNSVEPGNIYDAFYDNGP